MKSPCGILMTLILMIGISYHAKAVTWTGDVTGQVIEQETNLPVAFAEVVFENASEKITVTANEYGYYNVKHIPMGKYSMHISFNNRNFVMNNIKIKDSNTARVNFNVSSNQHLPSLVNVAANTGKIQSAPTTSQGEVVKYGSFIQDGKLIIVRNRPVSLYA